jgi:hypothetical protein
MSDGSNSLQRCEEVSGTESAEPPPSYGAQRGRYCPERYRA